MVKSVNSDSSSTAKSMPAERLALVSGIIYAILVIGAIVFFISNIVPHMGPIDAPASEHVKLYLNHGQLLTINNYMWVLPVPFFLVFLGGLYSLMRRAEGESLTFSTAALAAGITLIVPWITNVAVETLAVSIAKSGGDAATVWALDSLGPTGTMGLTGLARAAFFVTVALVVLRTQFAPRWTGWFAIVLAVLSFAGSFAFIVGNLFPIAWLTIPLMAIWTLGLSIALLRRPQTANRLVLEHVSA